MARTPGAKNKPNIKKTEQFDPEVKVWAKAEIIRLFDMGKIDDLSQASELVGVTKLALYSWRKSDKTWRDLLNQAEQPIADRLLKEILVDTMPNGKTINMPYVTARLFRVKKIRPEFRDSYHFVVEDSKIIEHLEALKALAKQEKPKEEKGDALQES